MGVRLSGTVSRGMSDEFFTLRGSWVSTWGVCAVTRVTVADEELCERLRVMKERAFFSGSRASDCGGLAGTWDGASAVLMGGTADTLVVEGMLGVEETGAKALDCDTTGLVLS